MQHVTKLALLSVFVFIQWIMWDASSWTDFFSGSDSDNSREFNYAEVNLTQEGLLTWVTVFEKDPLPFHVEQYAYNKWMKVGMIYGEGRGDSTYYEYRVGAVLNSGNNTFRIRRETGEVIDTYSQKVNLITNWKRVYHFADKSNDRILLSRRGYYYVYDEIGMLCRKGYGSIISTKGLLKGKYFLCYDDQVEKIKV